MKTHTRSALAALALAALTLAAHTRVQAQNAPAPFSPQGESFTVLMPGQPATTEQRLRGGRLSVRGWRYESNAGDGATYLVLSLRDPANVGERLIAEYDMSRRFGPTSYYLDAIAELVWQALVRDEFERHRKERHEGEHPSMTYQREFILREMPAREYSVKLPRASGHAYVAADGPRIYVVAALAPLGAPDAPLRRFVNSFLLKGQPPPTATLAVDPALVPKEGAGTGGVGPGRRIGPGVGGVAGPGESGGGGPVSYSRPFTKREVTRRAQITSKPQPVYTEDARKFGVTGSVFVSMVLGASGQVEQTLAFSRLPHGLTRKAVEAARAVKFKPAEKDGRKVSQYALIQYNFNIY